VGAVIALAALAAAGLAGGVLLVVAGMTGAPWPGRAAGSVGLAGERGLGWPRQRLAAATALGLASALLVALLTRWPVATVLAGALGLATPALLGANAAANASIARVEAIAVWVEHVRDTMAGGARGLDQAIIATAPTAPAPIHAEVGELAARLAAKQPLPAALRRFAQVLADPNADQVVLAMLLVANPRQRFGGVGDALTELAVATRERVKMRLRIEVGRARMRNVARFMVLWTAGFVTAQFIWTRDYLKPYSSLLGQLVLLLVGGLFAGAFWWLVRMSRTEAPERLLTIQPQGWSPPPSREARS
jgi:tight adherence protein B